MSNVALIKIGLSNLASIRAALVRSGKEFEIIESGENLSSYSHVVLPGVGAFGEGMKALKESGFIKPLQERFKEGKPILTICLGLQLFATESEETPGVAGLSLLPVKVTRFKKAKRVPQLGWNLIKAQEDCKLLESGYSYFANSYHLPTGALPGAEATSEHGEEFLAAYEENGFLGCQFHPELSGDWGQALINRWLSNGVQ